MTAAEYRTDHTVYRLYNTDEELIYVGYSGRVMGRLEDHAATKDWWSQVVRVKTETYLTQRAALRREGNLIVEHKPRYNVRLNTSYADSQPEVIEAIRVAVARYRAADADLRAAKKVMRATLAKARENHTMAVIARELGVSRQRIHQLTKDV